MTVRGLSLGPARLPKVCPVVGRKVGDRLRSKGVEQRLPGAGWGKPMPAPAVAMHDAGRARSTRLLPCVAWQAGTSTKNAPKANGAHNENSQLKLRQVRWHTPEAGSPMPGRLESTRPLCSVSLACSAAATASLCALDKACAAGSQGTEAGWAGMLAGTH